MRFGTVALWALAATLAAGIPAARAGKPGDAGFLTLRMPVGTRESAMGGAGVAAPVGAAAVWWNPARLALVEGGTDLLLQHQRLYGLFSKESACLAHRAAGGVIGVQFFGFYADEMDRYGEDAVGIPEGTFKPYDIAVGVSYARQVAERVAVGATVKLLHERIDVYSDTGFALDLFIDHQAMIEGLVLGASVTNLGGQLNLNAEPFDLPTAVRLGAAYDPPSPLLRGKVTLAGDIFMPNDGNAKAHVGAEYRVVPELALRVGSRVNYDNQGLTAGLGLRKGTVEVGYAFEESKVDGFDNLHKFSLELHY
ncbi:MAG: PorV/PorQ family protein [Candidatus Krumholzibacteriia bacterium]